MDISDFDISKCEVNPKWVTVRSYEIRDQTYDGTETYSKEEILTARAIIIDELKRENIEQYGHHLVLLDSENRTENTMVVHAIVHDAANKYDGNESRNRTFYIKDGKIIRIKKGHPKE